MGESRQELVAWVNDLLLLDISKVEQCGTGAIYCQIYDSIYGDVPMSKVRFNVNSEYQYLNNYKVLQAVFHKHGIEHPLNPDKLAKCKMQDNLEFLQWTRRFWDAHYDGTPYDPVARRRGQKVVKADNNPMRPPLTTSVNGSRPVSRMSSTGSRSSTTRSSTTRPSVANSTASNVRPRSSMANGGINRVSSAQLNELNHKIATLTEEKQSLTEANEIIESERDFYFQKLRDLEILIQTVSEQNDIASTGQDGSDLADGVKNLQVSDKFDDLIREIQAILYSTAEGFEIPGNEDQADEEF